MKNRAICRPANKKMHSFAKIDSAESHNLRNMHVPNADPSGQHVRLVGRDQRASDILKERLNEFDIKPRSNAVLAREFVLTFSPEAKGTFSIKEWAKANIDFMMKEYGKKGVLTMDLHLDETTPHIHVLVAPFIHKKVRGKEQWRLSGKDYWDGAVKMSKLQDRYAEAMEPFGLTRGLKGSKAAHKTIKEYYKAVNEAKSTAQKDLKRLDAKVNLEQHKKPGLFNLAKAWNSLMDKTKDLYSMLKEQLETTVMLREERQMMLSELKIARETISRVNQKYENSDLKSLENKLDAALNKASTLEAQRDKTIEIARQKLSERDNQIEDLSNQNEILNNILDRYQGRDYNLSR